MSEMLDAECAVVDAAAGEAMFAESDGVLFRYGEFEDRPLQFTAYVESDDVPHHELSERDRVYDSGAVSLYV